jgi:transposase
VDALGNPVHLQLSSGNLHDSTVAIEVLSHVMIKDSVVQADRAYGTTDIRAYISEQEAAYNIPPKSNAKEPWPCDWWLYKERHLVECFFQKIKQFRRVATRYDKLASRFFAFVLLAAICILVK